MKIGIIGSGNVGSVTGLSFLLKGHFVQFQDINKEQLEKVKDIVRNYGNFDYLVTTDLLEVVKECDVVFECLPTENDENGFIDLSILEYVVDKISCYEEQCGCKVFVQRSTCIPGTALKMSKKFKKIKYAVNPSFLIMKKKFEDAISPKKVVIGVLDDLAKNIMKDLYAGWNNVVIVNNFTLVELAKYAENCLQSTLISYWNEIYEISKKIGISSREFLDVLNIVSLTSDLASSIRIPGMAFGGACLPKDLQAFINFTKVDLNITPLVLDAVLNVNNIFKNKYGVRSDSSVDLYDVKNGRIVIKLEKVGYHGE